MPSSYPGSNDSFTEPTSPETTPLSSAGSGNKSHYEHHRDLGDAIEAIQANAALKTHDHSGTGARPTPKLIQDNTHESPDTDSSPTALHHTLGTGPNQAARGNHTHNAADIAGMGWIICTSTTRPGSPVVGMTIYESDTNRVRVWATFPPAVAPSWRLLPLASHPICRLVQGVAQQISTSNGSVIEWRTEEEDNFNMFNAASSLTEITIPEAGLYEVNTAVAWSNNDIFGDWAETVILLNGAETYRRNFEFIRGRTILSPGRPQTVAATGFVRYSAGDKVGVRAKHNGSGFQFTYSSVSQKQDSRIEIRYVSP